MARVLGKKRRWKPTVNNRPAFSAASYIAPVSATLMHSGFSHNTWAPASSAATLCSAWYSGGDDTHHVLRLLRPQHFPEVAVPPDSKLGGDRLPRAGVRLHECGQLHILQAGEDPEMDPAHHAGADHRGCRRHSPSVRFPLCPG